MSQKGAKGLKKALEKAVRACPVPPVRSKRLFEPASAPPVRSKRLFEPASAPPVRSKRLFESAVQDHYSKVLHSANTVLCASLLCSPCSVHVYARVHTSIYIYICYIYWKILHFLRYRGGGVGWVYILVWTRAYPCTEQGELSRDVQSTV